jgi:hypothetical protein
MTEELNRRIVRRWFQELWSLPDLDVADEIIVPEYDPEWIQIDAKGPAQVKHEIRYFRSIFPDLIYQILEMVTHENKVWVRYKGKGTQQGNAWGFDATSKKVEFEGVAIFTFNPEGMITNRWGAFCFYDILVDLELVPPLWELSKKLGDSLG